MESLRTRILHSHGGDLVTLPKTHLASLKGVTMIRSNLLACGGTLTVSALMVACGGSTATGSTTPAAPAQATTSGTTAPTSTSAGSGTVSDPCKLITPQEASAALGVDAGTPSGNAGQCAYTTATGSLTITATQYPDGSTAHSAFDSTRTAAMGGVPGFQDVTGIGDRAFLTASGLVEFAKGPIVVIIQVLSSANPTTNTMTTLGQAATGRV
jgi:hypothetical protein